MTAMRSAAYALQVAVKDRVQTYLPTWPISEKTQKNKKPPYIELYDISMVSSLDTKTTKAERIRLTIRVFDEGENSDAVKDAIDDIMQAISSSNLSLIDNFICYLQIHERTVPSVLQRDNKTWMGSTTWQFSIRQA
jgi:hypothetical protein